MQREKEGGVKGCALIAPSTRTKVALAVGSTERSKVWIQSQRGSKVPNATYARTIDNTICLYMSFIRSASFFRGMNKLQSPLSFLARSPVRSRYERNSQYTGVRLI